MKKSGKVILILVIALLVIVIAVGGYVLIKNDNEYNEKIAELENKIETVSGVSNDVENQNAIEEKNSTSNDTTKVNNTVLNNNTTKNSTETSSKGYTYDDVKGTYVKQLETEPMTEYRLYLNNDGTFIYYNVPDTECHLIGYYTINDNKISLNCILSYANDPSVTISTEVYEIIISDAKTLTDNNVAEGNLEKTSNAVEEEVNISEAVKGATQSEYFYTE